MGRKRIGLLINELADRYQASIWPGVVDSAVSHGADLIIIAGKTLRSPYLNEAAHNIVYQLIKPDSLDGLVILTGSLGNYLTSEQMQNFCNQYQPVPMTSIAFKMQNMGNVLVDNKTGMRELVSHFVKDHGYRRVAFIQGMQNNEEAALRFEAYKEVLEENGVPFDPALVVPGNFVWVSGIEGVKTLLDERKVTFEALIAANDDMLLGASQELTARGYRVPEDVALGGFDNIDETLISKPPITTVAQPLYQQARSATDLLFEMIEHGAKPETRVLAARMVQRKSCGCGMEYTGRDIGEGQQTILRLQTPDPSLIPVWKAYLQLRLEENRMSGLHVENWMDQLLSALVDEGHSNRKLDFLTCLREILDQENSDREHVEILSQILDILNELIVESIDPSTPAMTQLKEMMTLGRLTVAENKTRFYRHYHIVVRDQIWALRRVLQPISTAFDLEKLHAILVERLPMLGIGRFYMTLYHFEQPGEPVPTLYSRLFLAMENRQQVHLTKEEELFITTLVLPPRLLDSGHQSALVLFPLNFENDHFGNILMELDSGKDISIYENLREQISSSLMGARLFSDLKSAQEKLLEETRVKLIHSEKMAALGELTAGIAHELKNPLNIINNFADNNLDFLTMLTGELSKFPGAAETREYSQALGIIEDLRRNSEDISVQGKRADTIIRGMLNQARGDSGRIEEFDLNALLHDSATLAYHSSRSQFPDFNLKIEEETDRLLPRIRGNTSQLNRVFINIVTNAFYAMRKRRENDRAFQPVLTIRTSREEGFVRADITDNGTGIPDKVKEKLFQPFFTTKPTNEGTGLGLKISRDIIVDGHGGRMDFDSRENEYTRFSIWLKIQ